MANNNFVNCEKRRAMRKAVVDIGVLNHTLFGRTKSTHHPPGCHTSGVCEMNLVWQPKNPKRRTNL